MRGAPKHILNAYPPDQCPQFRMDWRATSWIPRLTAPVATKPGTMPAHQRLGPDDCDGFEDRRKPSIQQDEEQAIAAREFDATADLALQRDQLMSERSILRFKSARR